MEEQKKKQVKRPSIKLSQFPSSTTNPSIPHKNTLKTLKINVGDGVSKIKGSWGNTETGEVVSGSLEAKQGIRMIDTMPFTKLYGGGRDNLPQLNSCGISLLTFILQHLTEDKDVIVINQKKFLEDMKYSNHKNYYNGLFSLLKHKYIFRMAGENTNHFFINIQYFFFGYRTKLSDIKDALAKRES